MAYSAGLIARTASEHYETTIATNPTQSRVLCTNTRTYLKFNCFNSTRAWISFLLHIRTQWLLVWEWIFSKRITKRCQYSGGSMKTYIEVLPVTKLLTYDRTWANVRPDNLFTTAIRSSARGITLFVILLPQISITTLCSSTVHLFLFLLTCLDNSSLPSSLSEVFRNGLFWRTGSV